MRTISCAHRDGRFKEMVDGKTPSTNMQNKQTKPKNTDDICCQGWVVSTPTMLCAWELLAAAQHLKRDFDHIAEGKEQNSNLVEWFQWTECHLCTVRKSLNWQSPMIKIYFKKVAGCLPWAEDKMSGPDLWFACLSLLTSSPACTWVLTTWRNYWRSFSPFFAWTLSFLCGVWS